MHASDRVETVGAEVLWIAVIAIIATPSRITAGAMSVTGYAEAGARFASAVLTGLLARTIRSKVC